MLLFATPKERRGPTKLFDERGLYLLVKESGKYWRTFERLDRPIELRRGEIGQRVDAEKREEASVVAARARLHANQAWLEPAEKEHNL